MNATAVIESPGLLTAHGPGLPAFEEGLALGATPFRRWLGRDGAWFVGDIPNLSSGRGLRSLSRETRMFLAASTLAWDGAALDGDVALADVGVVCATTRAGLGEYAVLFSEGTADEYHRVTPARGPQTGLNAPSAEVAIRLGAQGPNVTVCSGVCGGLDAVAAAADMVGTGEADAILAGGVDALVLDDRELEIEALCEAASAPRGAAFEAATPAPAPRPYDSTRNGAVDGEVAAAVVVRPDQVDRPGAARLLGWASACAASADVADAGERALLGALEAARITPGAVAAVVSSASGDVSGDAAEASCLWAVFRDTVPVCSINGSIGRGHGAAGAAQVVVALSVLGEAPRALPATTGLTHYDPALPPIAVTAEPTPVQPSYAVVLALDPAGNATAVVLGGTAS